MMSQRRPDAASRRLEVMRMFTGIIRQVAVVSAVRDLAQSRRLSVDAEPLAAEVTVGDSINVDGVCLTAIEVRPPHLVFDVGAETLRLTTLGGLAEGARVNVEPALRVGDRLGGHFVSGHVDGTGLIARKEQLPGEVRLEVEAAGELLEMMVLKGSVAVDGISLTIAGLEPTAFEVSLIPHTLAATTLRWKAAGDRVNIECDMMGRWVRRLLGHRDEPAGGRPLTLRELEEQGF
jgi:riboflavin synthase